MPGVQAVDLSVPDDVLIEPKGEWDISGYSREGAREGDLAGAVSVRIPLEPK